eukprot:scaffold10297_cov113-Isochrysis_galbana.AAC.18
MECLGFIPGHRSREHLENPAVIHSGVKMPAQGIGTSSGTACSFRFGAGWVGEGQDYSNVDYLAVWIGQESADDSDPFCATSPCFNQWWHGAMLREAARRSIGAAYYG